MAEVINTNVFGTDKKFVDLSGLDYFWGKAKDYIDGVDTAMSERVAANEQAITNINDELESLSGGVGSVGTQIDNKIAALDLPNTYDAKGSADQALDDAKSYTDSKVDGKFDAAGTAASLNDAMDIRVKALEEFDHEQLAADASAAAVATVLDGAPEKFDTLKEIAAWIAEADTAEDAASLVTRVKALEEIDHDAYKDADTEILTDAKSYTDTAKSEAIAAAKADATETLKSYYTKSEVDSLLATNSEGDRAYAKTYTDALFNSFNFAAESDIDGLFSNE